MDALVFDLSSFSTFLPFVASMLLIILMRNYRERKDLFFLWLFFSFAAVTEIVIFISSAFKMANLWIFHIYTIMEYVLIVRILLKWHPGGKTARLMRISIPIFLFICLTIKMAGLENFSSSNFNHITRPLALLAISVFACLTLHDLWRDSARNLRRDYRFWMSIAIAIYCSGSTILFAFTFVRNQELLYGIALMHGILNILHNFLFMIGVFFIYHGQETATFLQIFYGAKARRAG